MASAMGNLVPAITFIMTTIFSYGRNMCGRERKIREDQYEKPDEYSKNSRTVLCMSGAISMALLRGPKLLNKSVLGDDKNWLLGCLFLFGSSCCWSSWLVLQVPATETYPDHLSLSAWMCFLATIHSAILAIFLEQDLSSWKLHSCLELIRCLFAGIIGSGVSFFIQEWLISQRGPLFSAMFNPLCTVIVFLLAALFLHEEIYIGSFIGAVGVIIGLYVVLWGKAKDLIEDPPQEKDPKLEIHQMATNMLIDEAVQETSKADNEEPLLS
ncbi:hypothetical protein JCGZ_04114 [Jatropha curcas]|uniref:WAT1-related protein n=1 Tax=Jatropha curcas TaxID=180498 RepID=A0A067KRE6_JATCU|nr:hypothetical protein JCGZ_04114 [Jatropha curcas]